MEEHREIYEKETKTPIPKYFHVHHLDGNKKNNCIKNLLALPSDLHLKYHARKPIVEQEVWHLDFQIKGPLLGWYIEKLKEFELVFDTCIEWLNVRDYLLDKGNSLFPPDPYYLKLYLQE